MLRARIVTYNFVVFLLRNHRSPYSIEFFVFEIQLFFFFLNFDNFRDGAHVFLTSVVRRSCDVRRCDVLKWPRRTIITRARAMVIRRTPGTTTAAAVTATLGSSHVLAATAVLLLLAAAGYGRDTGTLWTLFSMSCQIINSDAGAAPETCSEVGDVRLSAKPAKHLLLYTFCTILNQYTQILSSYCMTYW